MLNHIGVVSASHDQTLRVWTFQGDCIAELVGHTALVYSAACSDDGSLIASASEDNTVRTWRPDGQCLQTIEHPGTATAYIFMTATSATLSLQYVHLLVPTLASLHTISLPCSAMWSGSNLM